MANPSGNITATNVDIAALNGLFKVKYAKELKDLVPAFAKLQERVKFSPAEKTGSYFAQPVNLSHEGGVTYLGEDGAVAELARARAGVMKEAQVKGSEINLRGTISYKALLASLGEGSAHKSAVAVKALDMNTSIRHRLEAAFLYGQKGLGTVESVTDLTGNVGEIVITAATWSPGIWAGTEGHLIDSFTTTTKNNGTDPLIINSVDMDNRKLTVTYAGTLSSECAAADVLYFTGSYGGSTTWKEMAGLQKILTNTGSLFNIDAGSYSLWKGNSVSSVGELTFAKLQDAVTKAVNRGLMGKALVLLPTKAWSVINANEAAMRQYGDFSREAKNGSTSIKFYGANGEQELLAHPMVKEGDAFILPEEDLVRVGATDVTFSLDGERFFRFLDGYNAFELQCMADQAIFLQKPAQAVYLSGITYT
jgi:hypothetical protein